MNQTFPDEEFAALMIDLLEVVAPGIRAPAYPERGSFRLLQRGTLADARENGDTNGDSVLDLSDAVAIFAHLFGGGSEPVAIHCGSGIGEGGDAGGHSSGYVYQVLTGFMASWGNPGVS